MQQRNGASNMEFRRQGKSKDAAETSGTFRSFWTLTHSWDLLLCMLASAASLTNASLNGSFEGSKLYEVKSENAGVPI